MHPQSRHNTATPPKKKEEEKKKKNRKLTLYFLLGGLPLCLALAGFRAMIEGIQALYTGEWEGRGGGSMNK